MENAPEALLVPISINNSWKMVRYGKFPMGIGNCITHTVHKPIEIDRDHDELVKELERVIKAGIQVN